MSRLSQLTMTTHSSRYPQGVAPVTKPISQIALAPGSMATFLDVSWQEFESILQELGEKRRSRLAYSHQTLEIMVPLPEHEIPRDLISDIVKVLLKVTKQRFQPFGSTPFKQENSAGVEPDACFYIQNYSQMIGRRRLQPGDPPPDLAIEADVTSKTKLDAYEAIAVPELWIFDSGKLTLYVLHNGKYAISDNSPLFPGIPIAQIIPAVVDRAWQVGNLQALEELEAQLEK
jgi:Uma2 family endonuclease